MNPLPEDKKKRIRDYEYFTPTLYTLIAVCIALTFHYFLNNVPSISKGFGKIMTLLTPFILGGCIAYLLNPLLNFTERHGKKMIGNKTALRGISMLLTYTIAIVSIWVLVGIVFPQVYASIGDLIGVVIIYVNETTVWVTNWLNSSELKDYLTPDQINQITRHVENALGEVYELAKKIVPWVIGLTSSITNMVFNGILGIMVSIYLLLGKEKLGAQIKKTIYAWFPTLRADGFLDFLRLSDGIFNNFVVGNIIDSAIVGVLCFVVMALFQMPYTLLISVIVAVTNVIPYFGPFIGAIPSGLILLTVSPTYALGFAVIILIIQQIDGNVLKPLILGDSMGLSGIWILASVTIGGGLFGIAGMLLGVPICAITYGTFVTCSNSRLKSKGLPTSLSDYHLISPIKKPKDKNKKLSKENSKSKKTTKKK